MTHEPQPIRKRKYVIRPLASAGRAETRTGAERATVSGEQPSDLGGVARARYGRSREELIREAAHALAAQRGFRGGDPVADWLTAEAEVDDRLRRLIHG